ncbi:hypothetical protein BIFBRE_04128 [Bifidobacterium breve DSM 20213 = JCM 1192]|uniref:Uncharacterized protein n=1 Tax=Bifidobacterium breve DSM 20213 = JCM 1192 TaxID=518634 RepID=D4BPW3_BIFBR|nr:hypothetical protein BIFBRE_04128 [Bifidobacterium breve DSM 20213 = JCM 1192]
MTEECPAESGYVVPACQLSTTACCLQFGKMIQILTTEPQIT